MNVHTNRQSVKLTLKII